MEKENGKENMACPDNLYGDLARLFNSFFGDVLNILQIRYPHKRGDGSENENQFLFLRSKILRSGNDRIRKDLFEILSNYNISKKYESTVTKKTFVMEKFKVRSSKNG